MAGGLWSWCAGAGNWLRPPRDCSSSPAFRSRSSSGSSRWRSAGWCRSRRPSSPARPTWKGLPPAGSRWPRSKRRSPPRAFVPVLVDPRGEALARLRAGIIVDGRMAKRNLGTSREQARSSSASGRGSSRAWTFTPSWRRSAARRSGGCGGAARRRPTPESRRRSGARRPGASFARRATAFSGVACASASRWARAGWSARWGTSRSTPKSPGWSAASLADGVPIGRGEKVGDIEPRGTAVDPARISDKARAVAAGVLEAALIGPSGSRTT